MSSHKETRSGIRCRQAQRLFPAVAAGHASPADSQRVNQHVQSCGKCEDEYRLAELSLVAMNGAAAAEPILPDSYFFKSLRARIERGPDIRPVESGDESWAAALLMTARQLLPALAVLLLLIIGATMFWNTTHRTEIAARQDAYELQEPRPDDSLESLVAAEEDRRYGR
jgi:hypothetical protein